MKENGSWKWVWIVLIFLTLVVMVLDTLVIAVMFSQPDDSKTGSVAERLSVLSPDVRKSIKSVRIRNDLEHFFEEGKISLAHCHGDGRICIRADVFPREPEVLWHEAAHAYHFWLDKHNSDFTAKWRAIPEGVVTDYGATNYRDDVAEWLKEFHTALSGRHSAFDLMKDFPDTLLTPYREKLELLLQYRFITPENYQKFLDKYKFLSPREYAGFVFIARRTIIFSCFLKF